MKPVLLELNNFGPYVAQTVDFKQFDHSDLFLITGKTGSGKSTLFDAMCYALYGRTSGNQRTPEQMRSDFAQADEPTKVRFIFEHQGHTYEIERMPAQELKAKRGTKIVAKKPSVCLTYTKDDGEIVQLTKSREVQDFIVNLLELKAEQFVQTILLPQGKFQTFLLADSNKKEEVLRDLFGTKLFNQWVAKIQADAKKYQQQQQELEIKLAQLKQQVTLVEPNLTPLSQWQENLQTALATLKADLDQQKQTVLHASQEADNLLRQYENEKNTLAEFKQLAQVEQAALILEQQKPLFAKLEQEIQQLIWLQNEQSQILNWSNTKQQLQDQTKQLALKQQQLEQLQQQADILAQQLQTLEQQQPAMANLQVKRQTLDTKLSLFDELAKLQADLAKSQQDLSQVQQQKNQLSEKVASLTKQQADLNLQLSSFEDLGEQQILWQQQANQLNLQATVLQQLQLQAKQLTESQQNEQQLTKAVKQKEKVVAKLQEQLKQTKSDYAAKQIAQLAQDLLPNTPCPVCGSCDHPNVAHVSLTSDVTEQDLEKLQAICTQETEQLNVLRGKYQMQLTTLNQAKVKYQQELQHLMHVWQISEPLTLEQLNSRQQSQQSAHAHQKDWLAKQTKQMHTIKQQLATLAKQQPLCEQELTSCLETENKLKQQVQLDEIRLQEKQQQIPLGYQTKQQLASDLAKWQQSLEQFTVSLKQATVANHDQTVKIAESQSLVKNLQQQIHTNQQLEQQQTTTLLRLVKTSGLFEDLAQMQALLPELKTLEAKQQKLNDYHLQVSLQAQTKQTLLTKLAQKTKPDLEKTAQKLAQQKAQVRLLQDKFNQQQQLYHLNEQLLKQSQTLVQQQAKILEEATQYLQLSETLSGKNTLKLGFERYVLQSRFKEVLLLANQRLAKLTDGRYILCLNENTGNAMINTGLELNVYDDNIGNQRSVKTLSGGESFIAALCLALALGEIIQHQNGGIVIDALFIDEGFGSLDAEALNTALTVLQTIEGKQKMIGIISHVRELREQIADKMIIHSQNGKSYLSYQHEL